MTNFSRLAGACVVAVALLTACSSTPTAPPVVVPVQPTAVSVAASQPALSDGTSVSVVATKSLKIDGAATFAAQVRVCMGSLGTVSWSPWTLRDKAGDTFTPTEAFDQPTSMPLYPNDFMQKMPYQVGECVQGWLFFAVDAGRFPGLQVRYVSPAGPSLQVRVWTV